MDWKGVCMEWKNLSRVLPEGMAGEALKGRGGGAAVEEVQALPRRHAGRDKREQGHDRLLEE